MANRDSVSRFTTLRDSGLFPTLVRYALVGVFSNACGYCLYLGVTWLGVPPLVAMSLLYFVGATIGFLSNRKWAFSHRGKVMPSLVRYGITHALGYGLNFLLLHVFVNRLGYPHQLVQGIAILVVAGFLFIMFRFFVFPEGKTMLVS